MPNTPRSSFIPKQVTSTTPSRVQKRRVFSIVNIFATIFLAVSVALAGGVFFYKSYLGKDLENSKAALSAERGKFSEEDIAKVQNFDRQVRTAETLLSNHISPSIIFDALEKTTKESVQYTSFALERRPSGGVTVTLAGVTDEFAKVAFQSEEFMDDDILLNSELTQIALGSADGEGESAGTENKTVTFGIVSNILSDQLSFTVEDIDVGDMETDEEMTTEEDESSVEATSTSTTTGASSGGATSTSTPQTVTQ